MKFKSRYLGLIVVLVPTNRFLVDNKPVVVKGQTITFDDEGFYETEDKEIIELIKSKQFYGTKMWEVKNDAVKITAEVASLLKGESPEGIEEGASAKKTLSFNEFRAKFYEENKGLGVGACADSWNKYKKDNGIK